VQVEKIEFLPMTKFEIAIEIPGFGQLGFGPSGFCHQVILMVIYTKAPNALATVFPVLTQRGL
jgi:hypothetical protein